VQATVLWKYAAGDAVYSVRNLGDVNGDGKDDVLIRYGRVDGELAKTMKVLIAQ